MDEMEMDVCGTVVVVDFCQDSGSLFDTFWHLLVLFGTCLKSD